jgi:hypothetical protein
VEQVSIDKRQEQITLEKEKTCFNHSERDHKPNKKETSNSSFQTRIIINLAKAQDMNNSDKIRSYILSNLLSVLSVTSLLLVALSFGFTFLIFNIFQI